MSDEPIAEIHSWRLDLVRLRGWWKGAEHLKAKLELFALLAKSQWMTPSIEICIYTDSDTWERCYNSWLSEEGLENILLPDSFKIRVLASDPRITDIDSLGLTPREVRQHELEEWLEHVDSVMTKEWQRDDRLVAAFPPESLMQHQQTQYDSVLAIRK
jgi:hypothetical protein